MYPIDTQQLVVDLELQNERFACVERVQRSDGEGETSVFKLGRGSVLAFTPTTRMQDTLYKQYARSPVASEWSFLEVSTEVDRSDPRLSRSWLTYSHVFFALKVQRQPAFVLGTVFVPYFIVTTSLGIAAAVSATDPGTRLQITSTLFMTSIAMRYVTLSYLPRISYSTLMDSYVLMSLFFTACVEALVVTSPSVRGSFDRIAWIVLGTAWGCANALLVCLIVVELFLHHKRLAKAKEVRKAEWTEVKRALQAERSEAERNAAPSLSPSTEPSLRRILRDGSRQ